MAGIARSIENWRIKNHLKRAEKEMRAKNPNISEKLKAKRDKNLDRLRDYWERGRFPENRVSSSRTPIFKDRESGILCAMGYLMFQDGERELVENIVEKDNQVYLEDIDSGPVVDWIEDSGLSKKEAERIQPAYRGGGGLTMVNPSQELITGTYIFAGLSFLVMEWFAYRFASRTYPDNALKRYGTLFGLTILSLVGAVIVLLVSGFVIMQ